MTKLCAKHILVGLVVSTPGMVGCASMNLSPTNWQMPSFASEQHDPGTPEWWDDHQDDAEFVVGEGWRVPGTEGFFDDQGRPIRARVAKVVKSGPKQATLLDDIQVADSVKDFKEKLGMGPDQSAAEQLYAEGEALFRSQDYKNAVKKFKSAAGRWPGSRVEQDALFYKAESEFFGEQYPEAVDTYTMLLDKYPNSQHLDKVVRRQFDIAHYWEQHHQHEPHWATTPNVLDDTRPLFDTLGRALKTYENIRLNDPTGPLADDSIMASGNSYFLRGRYSDADYHYQLLRSEYPQSEHQFEAHILGLQCKLRIYQGEDYDATPLTEAKKIVKQLKIQFAGELNAEERERLAEIQAQLNEKLAERELKMAKYYDDGEHYGSAKFYYAQIVKNFPDTPIAEQARSRYVELGGEPDHPSSNMEWFVNLFPENAERQSIKQVPMLESTDTTRIATEPQDNLSNGDSIYR